MGQPIPREDGSLEQASFAIVTTMSLRTSHSLGSVVAVGEGIFLMPLSIASRLFDWVLSSDGLAEWERKMVELRSTPTHAMEPNGWGTRR